MLKFEFEFQSFIENVSPDKHRHKESHKEQLRFYKQLKKSCRDDDKVVFNSKSRLFRYLEGPLTFLPPENASFIFSSKALKWKKNNSMRFNYRSAYGKEHRSRREAARTNVNKGKVAQQLAKAAKLPHQTNTLPYSCSRDEFFTFVHALDEWIEAHSNNFRIPNACFKFGNFILKKLYYKDYDDIPDLKIDEKVSPLPPSRSLTSKIVEVIKSAVDTPLGQGLLYGAVGAVPIIQVLPPASSSSKNDD